MPERRSVLCVVFQFPPFTGSSGVQRPLRFVQYWSMLGWRPLVVSVKPSAYPQVSGDLLSVIPEDAVVRRAVGFDTLRHFAVAGRYPAALARPDRWVSWIPAGILEGLVLARRFRPQVLYSTAPPASAHVIAAAVARLTNIPWVAEFRDPLVEFVAREGRWAPADERLRRSRGWVESVCAKWARRLVFCTESASSMFLERHPRAGGRTRVVPNGYDEATFTALSADARGATAESPAPMVLLHSGVVYGGADRNPEPLLRAVRILADRGEVGPGELLVVFRGSAAKDWLEELARQIGVEDFVDVRPPCPLQESLREMMESDGLLVLQGYPSNPAIPAKTYEYLRTGRPILGVVDGAGETAGLLRKFRGCVVTDGEDADEMVGRLLEFIRLMRTTRRSRLPREGLERYERRTLAAEMAGILDEAGAFNGTRVPA